MLEYKGYKAKVEVDQVTGRLYGKVLDIVGEIPFEGETFKDVEQEFRKSIDAYLDFYSKMGKEPGKPFPGKYLFRTTPEVHRAIYLAASQKGKSINAWTEEVLSEAAKEELNPKVTIPHSLRPLVEESTKFAELIQMIDPFLESKEVGSTIQLINELEKLWLNVDNIRPFLKVQEPEEVSTFLIRVWSFFKLIAEEKVKGSGESIEKVSVPAIENVSAPKSL
jgi:predicted HicB family RNase H-like nuclease